MRVLHLETGRHLYGGARQVGNLIAGLDRLGLENLLVCDPDQPLTEFAPGARVLPLSCGGDLDFGFYRRLRRLTRETGPDIVHVHSRRGADTFGGRAAQAEAVPAILTRRIVSREPRALVRLKARPFAAVVAISSAVCQELAAAGVPPAKLETISSAVDTARFRPDPSARLRLVERYDLPVDACVAGAASQLIARKGIARLLPLAAGLIAAEPRFHLLLFGRGPQHALLERRIRNSGLAAQIILCGYVEDWPMLLPGLDLLLHPASREGLGSVLLEAMSAGVPVIASAVGGIRDVIEDGVDGCLLPPDAAEAWVAAALALVRDRSAARAIAARARLKLERRFTIDAMAQRYLEVYRRVIAYSAALR